MTWDEAVSLAVRTLLAAIVAGVCSAALGALLFLLTRDES